MGRWLWRLRRTWFNLPLLLKGMLLISAPLVCILFSVSAISMLQREREHLTDWIARAFRTGTGIQSVVTLLSDAESGARGFLLTADARYLEPVHKAEAELPKRLARLREYVGDSPSQRKRLRRLDDLTHERIAALAASVAAARPPDLATQLDHGRALALAIDNEFAAMREEESRLWNTRIQAESELRRRLSVVMYGTAGLSLLACTLAMGLFLTGIVRRAQALKENAERLVRGAALLELAGGDDEIGQVGVALSHSSRLLTEREDELRQLNAELEHRVQERTTELEREIAGREKFEEQLRQAQKMDAIGRLAGGIAHDFNNALTVIIGFAESVAEKVAGDPEAKEDLAEVLQAANHAASLTRQLLAFSRRQVVQPKVIDLNAVVARMDRLLRRVVGEDIEIQTICPPAPERILMDEGQLEQVIMNLAVNARDAMPNGGALTIQTDVVDLDDGYCASHLDTSPGRHAMLAVRDSGHGMSPEVQARIFEPFFTTKGTGKGTGLGLATVYGIVKQSSGSIWVYSEPGSGTTFKLYFPVAIGTALAAQTSIAELTPKSTGTILLVEDEPGVRRITKQALQHCGYAVLEADGAEAARRICREYGGGIDLLLTDVVMPQTNGRELAGELTAEYPALRVLYMSGYTDDVITRRAIIEPGVAFIEKPFTGKTIAAKVREVMAGN